MWWGFALAGLALAAFVLVERRIAVPLLPFELFRRRNFSVANAETFLVYGAISGLFLFLPIYLQFLGFTPFEAGLISVPPSILLIMLAARFGGLADRHGPRVFLTLGPPPLRRRDPALAADLVAERVLGVYGIPRSCSSLGLGDARGADHRDLDHVGAEQFAGIASGGSTRRFVARRAACGRGDRAGDLARVRVDAAPRAPSRSRSARLTPSCGTPPCRRSAPGRLSSGLAFAERPSQRGSERRREARGRARPGEPALAES